jgi:hypothetical protein
MSQWPKEELSQIARSEELEIAPLREDGKTYRAAIPIWSVAVGDALYVRAYKGPTSHWFNAALSQRAGRVQAAGVTKEVTFEPVEARINDLVDDAYRKKYARSPYVSSMVTDSVRSTTLKVMPRTASERSQP